MTAKGGAGLFAQEPTPDQTDIPFGNPALKSERALHLSTGRASTSRAPGSRWTSPGSTRTCTNLVSSTGRVVTNADGVHRPLIYDNNGTGQGLWASRSWPGTSSPRSSPGGWPTPCRAAPGATADATEDRLFDYDQTHILTLVGSYLLPRNWQIGGRFRLVSGNPITPVTGCRLQRQPGPILPHLRAAEL